mmetsp:Transcript_7580/g.24717  ORF Transcript_7580/g.24717 Transcript_7580/m.24717 type:complete len:203 (+) Transcript_7580:183-791(+)
MPRRRRGVAAVRRVAADGRTFGIGGRRPRFGPRPYVRQRPHHPRPRPPRARARIRRRRRRRGCRGGPGCARGGVVSAGPDVGRAGVRAARPARAFGPLPRGGRHAGDVQKQRPGRAGVEAQSTRGEPPRGARARAPFTGAGGAGGGVAAQKCLRRRKGVLARACAVWRARALRHRRRRAPPRRRIPPRARLGRVAARGARAG